MCFHQSRPPPSVQRACNVTSRTSSNCQKSQLSSTPRHSAKARSSPARASRSSRPAQHAEEAISPPSAPRLDVHRLLAAAHAADAGAVLADAAAAASAALVSNVHSSTTRPLLLGYIYRWMSLMTSPRTGKVATTTSSRMITRWAKLNRAYSSSGTSLKYGKTDWLCRMTQHPWGPRR